MGAAVTDAFDEILGETPKPITAEGELTPALQIPAVWADRFIVSFSGERVRIAFAEMAGTKEPHFRTAVALSHGDALALGQLLINNIKLAAEKAEGSA